MGVHQLRLATICPALIRLAEGGDVSGEVVNIDTSRASREVTICSEPFYKDSQADVGRPVWILRSDKMLPGPEVVDINCEGCWLWQSGFVVRRELGS